jgi:hypothetical protein
LHLQCCHLNNLQQVQKKQSFVSLNDALPVTAHTIPTFQEQHIQGKQHNNQERSPKEANFVEN